MDYTQERVATLHDFGDADPAAPVERAVVVVPMTEREYGGLAAEGVLGALEDLSPARVVVPLRAPADRVGAFADWLASFSIPLSVVWCNGPETERELGMRGLDGEAGKGRDVWLGVGLALADADAEFVVVHDADAKSYEARHVRKLLYPLSQGRSFAKAYYARVENDRLYGRLFRLFYAPLVAALETEHDHPVLDYLGAFRYALAGECAMTSDLAASMRFQRRWGLEVGTLGEAFRLAGPAGSAQVDLGRHEHDHRAVSGPAGLTDMSEGVAHALFRAVEDAGVAPDYETLPDRYREGARDAVEGYALDAGFNGLAYDRGDEREQVAAYADAVSPPEADGRLPSWAATDLDPDTVRRVATADLTDAGAAGVAPGGES